MLNVLQMKTGRWSIQSQTGEDEREREDEKEPGIENGQKPMRSAAFSVAAVLRSRRRGNIVKRKCRGDIVKRKYRED